jgi:hypothetical protein
MDACPKKAPKEPALARLPVRERVEEGCGGSEDTSSVLFGYVFL